MNEINPTYVLLALVVALLLRDLSRDRRLTRIEEMLRTVIVRFTVAPRPVTETIVPPAPSALLAPLAPVAPCRTRDSRGDEDSVDEAPVDGADSARAAAPERAPGGSSGG